MSVADKIKNVASDVVCSAGPMQSWYITIEKGECAQDEDVFSQSDLYLKIDFGGKMERTRTIKNDNTPTWNETFNFKLHEGHARDIHFKLLDEDTSRNDVIGTGSILHIELPSNAGEEKVYKIPITKKDKVRGTIHLRIKQVVDNELLSNPHASDQSCKISSSEMPQTHSKEKSDQQHTTAMSDTKRVISPQTGISDKDQYHHKGGLDTTAVSQTGISDKDQFHHKGMSDTTAVPQTGMSDTRRQSSQTGMSDTRAVPSQTVISDKDQFHHKGISDTTAVPSQTGLSDKDQFHHKGISDTTAVPSQTGLSDKDQFHHKGMSDTTAVPSQTRLSDKDQFHHKGVSDTTAVPSQAGISDKDQFHHKGISDTRTAVPQTGVSDTRTAMPPQTETLDRQRLPSQTETLDTQRLSQTEDKRLTSQTSTSNTRAVPPQTAVEQPLSHSGIPYTNPPQKPVQHQDQQHYQKY